MSSEALSLLKGYQMDKVKGLATLYALAFLIIYGWRPVAWAVCRLMGWM